MNAVCRNLVVWKLRCRDRPIRLANASCRIENRIGLRRKVSHPHCRRGHVENSTTRPPGLESFKIRHEKQTVFPVEQLWNPDRATDCESVLVQFEWLARWPRCSEGKLFGIQFVVAKEFENRAMQIVGASFGRNVDLAGGATKLGRENPRLPFQFLEAIG